MRNIKVWLNMAVNALSFAAFLSLLSTGLILQFRLPPGSGPHGGHGGARAGIKEFFGMTRHDWGEIHFVVAMVFLALLFVHLALHWKWLYCTAWGTHANPQPLWRRALTFIILLYAVLSLTFPFIR